MSNINRVTISLPFSGFYNSIHNMFIDSLVERHFEVDCIHDLTESQDNSINYAATRLKYCKELISFYSELAQKELAPVPFELTFNNLYSPREYNFETDQIMATISMRTMKSINAYVSKNLKAELTDYLLENCTTRDGFYSYYSNDVNEWLNTPFKDFTQAQLSVFFEVYLGFSDINPFELESPNLYEIEVVLVGE